VQAVLFWKDRGAVTVRQKLPAMSQPESWRSALGEGEKLHPSRWRTPSKLSSPTKSAFCLGFLGL
jgi:hypothetical protein